jgi:2'-5' RNA ligase
MTGADKIRLFVGVPIALDSVRAISRAVAGMQQAAQTAGLRVRWVSPANYHVTLKFLGWTRAEALPAIADALGRALTGAAGFSFEACGAGAFPRASQGRVLWIGVDDPQSGLARLADAVDRALAPVGFRPEKRAYHPHITLGRLREVAKVDSLVQCCAEQRYSVTRVDLVRLYESIMKSDGSEYPVSAEWRLRRPGGTRERHTEAVETSFVAAGSGPNDDRDPPDP